MEINLTATTMAIVGLVLTLLIIILSTLLTKKKPNKKQVIKKQIDTSMETLQAIIRKKTSSSDELSEALNLVIKYHGNISEQPSNNKKTSFDAYIDILVTICRHPNTNKNIIINFDSALSKKNPKHKATIEKIVTRSLNSR
jgi:ABC-type Zn uptake system ZnuABC Zn-binding protein ZnuA